MSTAPSLPHAIVPTTKRAAWRAAIFPQHCAQLRIERARPLLMFLLLCSMGVAQGDEIELRVRETAGIRRFSYPVHVQLKVPHAVTPTTPFRLLSDGRPIAAQFSPQRESGDADRWWLDFPISLGPHEERTLTVKYGAGVEAGPERSGGLELEETDDAFVITNAPYLEWTVAKDLSGVVRRFKTPSHDYLQPSAIGLQFMSRDGRVFRFSDGDREEPIAARVARRGRLAIALTFEKEEREGRLEGVRSRVTLEFPATKSWVKVNWQVEDPGGRVAQLGTQLALALGNEAKGEPTMADFGATTLVYAALRPGWQFELVANSDGEGEWQVLRSTQNGIAPFVVGSPGSGTLGTPEGWVHLMDQEICVAAGLHEFGRSTSDRIRTGSAGDLAMWREYRSGTPATEAEEKRLHYGLHFVPFPPHVSAATSAQSMLAPLVVEVGAPRPR